MHCFPKLLADLAAEGVVLCPPGAVEGASLGGAHERVRVPNTGMCGTPGWRCRRPRMYRRARLAPYLRLRKACGVVARRTRRRSRRAGDAAARTAASSPPASAVRWRGGSTGPDDIVVENHIAQQTRTSRSPACSSPSHRRSELEMSESVDPEDLVNPLDAATRGDAGPTSIGDVALCGAPSLISPLTSNRKEAVDRLDDRFWTIRNDVALLAPCRRLEEK